MSICALDRPFFLIRIEQNGFDVRESYLTVWKCFETFVGLAVLRFHMHSFHGIAPDLDFVGWGGYFASLGKRYIKGCESGGTASRYACSVITTRWWLKYSTVFPEKMLPYFLHTRLRQILTQKYSQQPLTGHFFCWNCVSGVGASVVSNATLAAWVTVTSDPERLKSRFQKRISHT